MSIVYHPIDGNVADEKDIPEICVQTRKNGRKWKWIVDVDAIFVDDRDKDKISESGIKRIFERAREIDEDAQTLDSARYYSDRQEIWSMEKNSSQGIFQLLMRDKEDAIELADFIRKIIEDEFDVEVSTA